LKLLQKKDFKHLYIEEQFEKYFKIIPENILILRINDAELARAERVKALLTYADQRLDDLYAEPTEKNILNVDYLSEQISKYLDDDKGALLNILNYKADYDAKSHVVNVATLSTSIHQRFEPMLKDPNVEKRNLAFAQKLSFTPLIKKNIVLAGLLHDLKSTLKCPKDQPTYNARQEAIKLLSSIKSIPPMVIEMIEHHEEKFDGSGPRKMYKANINIYSHILIVTVQYQTSLSKGKTPQEVLVEMFREKEKYNEVILNALKRIVVL
jgi:HD-GYP domain-containing protein (c-di-GMP phosphodiesterase class II)